jgi:hypothetical protein
MTLPNLVRLLLGCAVLLHVVNSIAAPVRVRHIEGLTHGFLVLRDQSGKALAYGELDQVLDPRKGVVTADLHFRFTDGSFYQEVTRFTQRREFHLVSYKVLQKGASFKQQSEAEVDTATGTITVRTNDGGKENVVSKHLNLPPDLSNGMLPVLIKNLTSATSETVVSMVSTSSSPRVVHLHIQPLEDASLKFGSITMKTQHFIIKVKIGGVAGLVAPIVGKQPPDLNMWIVKSAAPAFLQSEGPLSEGNPVWRIEISTPEKSSLNVTP